MEKESETDRVIGTTGNGIGITYAMKSAREGIRVADLNWEERIALLSEEDRAFLDKYRKSLLSMAINMAAFIGHQETRRKRVLFEGAQGAMLDLDSGTYPYVTSGLCSAAGASTGGAIGPRKIDKVLGIFKSYVTRGGHGPLPTEMRQEDSEDAGLLNFIHEAGHEYLSPGQPRRVGYLDLPALRYVCQVNSIDSLMLTHLDILDTLPTIKACVAYNYNGAQLRDFPSSVPVLEGIRPVYRSFKGWMKPTGGVRYFEHLPQEAKDYIRFIEDFCETPVSVISVGLATSQTLKLDDPWG
jgi:adenylosuccinate synthase